MAHNYERTAASSVPTMWSVLENWVNHFMAQVVSQIPSNLKVDGIRSNPVKRGYAQVETKGYSKGDLEAVATVSVALDLSKVEALVVLWYKDASMNHENSVDLRVSANDDPSQTLSQIQRFFDGK